MRKLTKREKISLGLLLILGFSYLYMQFLVIPQYRNMAEVKAELDTVEKEAEKVANYKSSIKKLDSELERESEKLDDALKRNFTELNQEDIIMLVDSIAEESGLISEGVSFSRPTSETVAEEELKLNTAELSFKGGYQTLTDFLEKLSVYKKRILVDRIAVDRDSDDLLTGTVFMKMYSLEDVVEETESLFVWKRDSDYFASNPFSPFTSYIEAMRREEAQNDMGLSNSNSSGNGTDIAGSGSFDDENTYSSYYPPSTGSSGSFGTGTSGAGTTTSGAGSGGSSTVKPTNPSTEGGSSSGGSTKPNSPSTPSKPSTPSTPTPTPTPIPTEKKLLVENFESSGDFFLVGSPREDVFSSVVTVSERTEGNKSINLKYNFLKERRKSTINMGFVKEIYVNDKHSKISIDVKPLVKNSHTLNLVIKDSKGRYHDIGLSDGLDWSGWNTISVDIPADATFPVAFQRLYIESEDYDEILLGDLLLDNLLVVD